MFLEKTRMFIKTFVQKIQVHILLCYGDGLKLCIVKNGKLCLFKHLKNAIFSVKFFLIYWV